MMRFSDMKIRSKLVFIMVSTGTLVLLLAMVAMLSTEYSLARRIIGDELHTLSDVVGWNCGASLAFNDEDAATKTLAALRTKPGISAAYLYNDQGKVFSSYHSSQTNGKRGASPSFSLPPNKIKSLYPLQFSEEMVRNGNLILLVPVNINGEPVGILQIVDDQSELKEMIRGVYWVTGLIILISLSLIFLLSSRLQRIFTAPVQNLIAAMNGVSEGQDFSTRVEKKSNDEFGSLTDVFNNMISEIQTRDSELKNHREHLEGEVADRTRQLSTTVKNLEVATQEALEAKEVAEAANKAKSEFLATMSHEIRTPMNGVLGMAELLAESKLTPRQAHFATSIQNSGLSLLAIINDILDFSKIESGMLKIDESIFHMGDFLEDVVEMMAEQASKSGLEVILAAPTSARVPVYGDALRIRQVLVNLIGNAIKFTEEGHILIRVYPGAFDVHGTTFRIEVIDSGIGMSRKVMEKVFSAFTQADGSTTRHYGGTGLGLSISKQLVELMGGQIGVESQEGRGSTFWFELNLPCPASNGTCEATSPRSLEGKSLLLVDDSPMNLEILAEFANAWSMNSACIQDADQAIQALHSGTAECKKFDAIILDRNLPDRDGAQLAKEIRALDEYRDTPIIMLSSTTNDIPLDEMKSLGIHCYLQKPARKNLLFNKLVSAFDKEPINIEEAIPVSPPNLQSIFQGRVLVAEDNPVNQDVACGMLELLGLEVVIAENGAQAVTAFEKQSFDLVFMDCHMPDMDGFTAARTIREREKKGALDHPDHGHSQAIIALTANVQKEVQYQCLAAGMDDYLSKPFTGEQLAAILKKWLPSKCLLDCPTETVAVGQTPEPAITEERQILDTANLDALRQLQRPGKPDVVTSMIKKYFLHYDEKCHGIVQAILNKEPQKLAEAAHFLKSSSSNLGAVALAALCLEFEKRGRAGTIPEDPGVTEEFTKISNLTKTALENHMTEVPSC